MRFGICLVLFALATAWCPACGKDPENAQGSKKRPDKASNAARIVSLTPSATAILEELGALDRLVGRDKFSDSPESIRVLPVVGDFATPNIEAIVALRPDLVLLDASQENARLALTALEVNYLVLTMHKLADVTNGLRKIGNAVGKGPQAEAHISALESSYDEIRERAKERERQPKVLLIIDRAPDSLRNIVAAGPGSYLDELLAIVGASNVMASSDVLYPQLGAEQILRTAPDIIIDVSHAQGTIEAYRVVAEVPAVAHNRVHIIDEPTMRAPTPKASHALERLFELTSL